MFVACLRHEGKEDNERDGGRGAESEKRDAVAEMIDDQAGGQGADRRADTLSGRNGALREIVSASAVHDIRDDQGCERLIYARADAVEELDRNQPEGVVRERIERRADRQGREGDEKIGRRPQESALRPTRIAIGNITPCAATMQNDIIAVASFGN